MGLFLNCCRAKAGAHIRCLPIKAHGGERIQEVEEGSVIFRVVFVPIVTQARGALRDSAPILLFFFFLVSVIKFFFIIPFLL